MSKPSRSVILSRTVSNALHLLEGTLAEVIGAVLRVGNVDDVRVHVRLRSCLDSRSGVNLSSGQKCHARGREEGRDDYGDGAHGTNLIDRAGVY